jgi:hypothetical protein
MAVSDSQLIHHGQQQLQQARAVITLAAVVAVHTQAQ